VRLYADTSALVKLLRREPETDALRNWLGETRPELLCSALVLTELGRVALTYGLPLRSVSALLQQLGTVSVTDDILRDAGRLPAAPGQVLRSLDAIHLATALYVGFDTVLTYDARMSVAAEHAGLAVAAPR
jgi:predicted nucleic acid-binding protein